MSAVNRGRWSWSDSYSHRELQRRIADSPDSFLRARCRIALLPSCSRAQRRKGAGRQSFGDGRTARRYDEDNGEVGGEQQHLDGSFNRFLWPLRSAVGVGLGVDSSQSPSGSVRLPPV